MHKILPGLAIVASLALATAAAAQGTGSSSGTGQASGSSSMSQGSGGTGSGGTSGAAPVGHRQPRVGDVPDEKNVTNTDPQDAALDRAMRGICRGC